MRSTTPSTSWQLGGASISRERLSFGGSVVVAVLLGYYLLGRSFAYLGVPALNVFVGEVALLGALVLLPRSMGGRLMRSVIHPTILSGFSRALLLFGVWGAFEVVLGVRAGYAPLTALQNFAFNYYPLYLLLGIWAAIRNPSIVVKAVTLLAWLNAIYGIAYVLALSRVDFTVPGTADVSLFGQPVGSMVAVLGLIIMQDRIRSAWFLLALNTFVLLGIQVRAEWLGVIVGLTLWGILTARIGRLFQGAAAVALLLTLGYLTNFQIPSPEGRGGTFSVQDVIARAISPIATDTAVELAGTSAIDTAGTVSWRTDWWTAIWTAVNTDSLDLLLGLGYGYPLSSLVPYITEEMDVRTPHNVVFYALGYSGWVGLILFLLLQLQIALLLWRVYKSFGEPLGLVVWIASLANAMFSNFFETPFGAIPFYLLMGLCVAPIIRPLVHAEELHPPGFPLGPLGSFPTSQSGDLTSAHSPYT